MRKWE